MYCAIHSSKSTSLLYNCKKADALYQSEDETGNNLFIVVYHAPHIAQGHSPVMDILIRFLTNS